MQAKMYLVALLQAALVFSALAQNEYSKEENQYSGEKLVTQSSKEGPYRNSESPVSPYVAPVEPSTKQPLVDSYPAGHSAGDHKDGEYHSGVNRRDAPDASSTLKPTKEPVPTTTGDSSFGFNRHRRESPTIKPLFPSFASSSSVEPEKKPTSTTLKPHSHHKRDLPGFTFSPQSESSSSSSSSTTERESRFFITQGPAGSNGTTTRRSFFNRNRRDTSDEASTTTKKSPHFHVEDDEHDESKEATKFPRMHQDSSSTHASSSDELSTTTKRFGISRFRRNSHEFPPEDEEQGADHSGHNHPSTPDSVSTTKKIFHTRAQRALPEDDLVEKRTSTTEQSDVKATSVRGHPIFHLGHSDEKSSSSSTEKQASNPGIRVRRSDDFGSQGFFNRPTPGPTQEPSTSGTKESSESTTRQFGGFFRN